MTIRAGAEDAAKAAGALESAGQRLASGLAGAEAAVERGAQALGGFAQASNTARVMRVGREEPDGPLVLVDSMLREAAAGDAVNGQGQGGSDGPGRQGAHRGGPGFDDVSGPDDAGGGLGQIGPDRFLDRLAGVRSLPGMGLVRQAAYGILHLGQIVAGTISADLIGMVLASPDVAQATEYAIMRRAAQIGILGRGQVTVDAKTSVDPYEVAFLGSYEEDKGIAALRATVNQVRRAYFLTGREIEALWEAMGEQALHGRHTIAGARIMRHLGLSVGQAGNYLRTTNAYVGRTPIGKQMRARQRALSIMSVLAPQPGADFALRTTARWLPWSTTPARPVTLETSMAFAQARNRPAEYLEDVATYARALGDRTGTVIDERLALGMAALMNKPVMARGGATMLGGTAGRAIGLAAIEGAAFTGTDVHLGEKIRAVRQFLPSLSMGAKGSAVVYNARRSATDARIIVESGDPRTWAAYAKQALRDAKRLGLSREWARAKFGDMIGGQVTTPQAEAIWARVNMAAMVLGLEDVSDASDDWRSGPMFKGKDGSAGLGMTRAMADSAQHSMGRVFLKMANDLKDAAVIAAGAFEGDWLDYAGNTMLQALQSVDPDTVRKLSWLALASGNPRMGTALAVASLPQGRPRSSMAEAVEGAAAAATGAAAAATGAAAAATGAPAAQPAGAAPVDEAPARVGFLADAIGGVLDDVSQTWAAVGVGRTHAEKAAVKGMDPRITDYIRKRQAEAGFDTTAPITDADVNAYEDELKALGIPVVYPDDDNAGDDAGGPAPAYRLPSAGRVFSHYGHRRAGMHHGADFMGDVGSDVVSVDDGRVSFVQSRGAWEKSAPGSPKFRAGVYVEVTHADGRVSRYMHLDSITDGLKVGSRVKAGERLGALGGTGILHDKPHLHFEIREPSPRGGRYGDSIDPREVFDDL